MTDLAHVMESLLDRLRKGTLAASTQVVDALLQSLDALRLLKEELVTSQDSGVDIASIIERLESAAEDQAGSEEVESARELETAINLDQDASTKLQEALASGQNRYRTRIELSRETPWAAIRYFQLLSELS